MTHRTGTQSDAPHTTVGTPEAERCRKLRVFLTAKRSELTPEAVGLPRGARRRVAGLRREEVAELIGVSTEWYRWFETGRTRRVSQQFLARLAIVLQLSAEDQVTLYHLALPELYEAELAAHGELVSSMTETLRLLSAGPPMQPRTVSVSSTMDLADAVRQFALAREHFLSEGDVQSVEVVRPRILASWKRSQAHREREKHGTPHATPFVTELRKQWRADNEELLRAGAPVVATLGRILEPSGYAIALSDAEGHVIELAGDRNICDRLSEADWRRGGDWTEATAGTNAIGTVLVDARPLQLVGAEHFGDDSQDLTCAAAPIRDYVSDTMAGVLVISGHYDLARPELTALASQYALEIEEELASRDRR